MWTKALVGLCTYPALTILITNSVSSLRTLGSVNGVAVATAGFGRAIGPACAGAVFSWGIARDMVIAPWWFLAVVSIVGAVPCFLVEEPQALADKMDHEAVEEDEEDALLREPVDQTKTYGTTEQRT